MLDRLAYRLSDAAYATCRSEDSLRRAIARGELHARKDGRSTIILRQDLEAWLETLPAFESAKRAATGAMLLEARRRKAAARSAAKTAG